MRFSLDPSDSPWEALITVLCWMGRETFHIVLKWMIILIKNQDQNDKSGRFTEFDWIFGSQCVYTSIVKTFDTFNQRRCSTSTPSTKRKFSFEKFDDMKYIYVYITNILILTFDWLSNHNPRSIESSARLLLSVSKRDEGVHELLDERIPSKSIGTCESALQNPY